MFYALLAGQVMIGAILWLQLKEQTGGGSADTGMFGLLVPAIVLGGVGASFLLQKFSLSSAASLHTTEEKWGHFQKIWVLRAALQEGANLSAIVLALMTGQTRLMLWFPIGVAAFILLRPSLFAFGNDYDVEESGLEEIAS
ncbi:MAG: hypothetical protein EPO28_09750 [Saprospiraceae bacterium]|nr:MAG: hypothetical protein EPO28_09750 [Saprospiraceae bacterium]